MGEDAFLLRPFDSAQGYGGQVGVMGRWGVGEQYLLGLAFVGQF